MTVNHQQIMLIEERTRDQRTNPDWHAYRSFRFTASNFGKLLRAEEDSFKYSDSQTLTKLIQEMRKNPSISPCAPMQLCIDQ